jgi:hypothetical protein
VAADRCTNFAARRSTAIASTGDHRCGNRGLDNAALSGRKNPRRNDGRRSIITARPSMARVKFTATPPSLEGPFFMRQRGFRPKTAQFE